VHRLGAGHHGTVPLDQPPVLDHDDFVPRSGVLKVWLKTPARRRGRLLRKYSGAEPSPQSMAVMVIEVGPPGVSVRLNA